QLAAQPTTASWQLATTTERMAQHLPLTPRRRLCYRPAAHLFPPGKGYGNGTRNPESGSTVAGAGRIEPGRGRVHLPQLGRNHQPRLQGQGPVQESRPADCVARKPRRRRSCQGDEPAQGTGEEWPARRGTG